MARSLHLNVATYGGSFSFLQHSTFNIGGVANTPESSYVFSFSSTGGGEFVVLSIAFGLLYVFVVAYSNLVRSDHISLINEYKCEKKHLRHLHVDASSLKRLMFRSALTGVRIRLVALTSAIP